MIDIIKEKHVSEETALVVDDYPYGWKRTKIRYWVESVKNKGDRFCRQTLNPKTGVWNKPKKGTYNAVVVLVKNDIGHVKCLTLWNSFKDKNDVEQFKAKVGDYEFNDVQKTQINRLLAMDKALEGVTYECRPVKYRHKVTGEIKTQIDVFELGNYEKCEDEVEKDKEQELIKNHIFHKANVEFNRLQKVVK
jgi:hypothetical protein